MKEHNMLPITRRRAVLVFFLIEMATLGALTLHSMQVYPALRQPWIEYTTLLGVLLLAFLYWRGWEAARYWNAGVLALVTLLSVDTSYGPTSVAFISLGVPALILVLADYRWVLASAIVLNGKFLLMFQDTPAFFGVLNVTLLGAAIAAMVISALIAESDRRTAEASMRHNQDALDDLKAQSAALRASEERYHTLFDTVPVGLYRTTPDGQILDVNQAVCELMGFPDRETLMAEQAPEMYVNLADRTRWQQLIEQHEVVADFEVRWRRRDGGLIWVLDYARAIRDPAGNLLFYEGMVKDITARKGHEQALELQRNLALALNSASDPHTVLQQLLELTLALDGMTGGGAYLVDEDTGALHMVVHQGLAPEFAAQVSFFAPDTPEARMAHNAAPQIQEGTDLRERYRTQGWQATAVVPLRHEGQTVAVLTIGSTSQPWLPAALTNSLTTIQGQAGSVLARLRAEAIIRERDDQIYHLAFTDQLTGLPNRNHLYREGERRLARGAAHHAPLALLYIDVDRVKVINDTLGYTAGDDFLVYAATILKQCVPETSLLTRIGSDEFVVLLCNATTDDALAQANTVLTCSQTPALLGNEIAYFNACIGIATGQAGAKPLSQLLAQAEDAMYWAKQLGRRIQMYEPSLSPMLQQQLHLENDLRHALEHDDLILHYQPILNVQTNRIAIVEALVRWQHPTHGMLTPGVFLPLAEELRLLDTLDRQVLRKALRQAALWEAASHPLAVSVNISAPTLQSPDLIEDVAAFLREAGVSPARIILEVTEHSALRDLPTSQQVLTNLRGLGLRIALDDFGTGYASLTHLRHLPVDIVKLDRAFAAGIGCDAKDEAVIQTLLALGRGLELDVVVEGIEYAEQLKWLWRGGCPFIQGYFLSRPCPAAEIESLLT
jgi:diguanylate cyclase (GGDEF)-like protein/PAS domain S-box-containing protein